MTITKPWKKQDREELIEYYRRQRSQGLKRLVRTIENPMEPAILGTIVILPILIVIFIVDYALEWINGLPGVGLLEFTGIYIIDEAAKVTLLVIGSAILVTGTGRFVRTRAGFKTEKLVDHAFDQIPVLGSIYSTTKITIDTIFSGADELREPVKLDFQGVRLTAFRTGNTSTDGRKILFLPTSPNITTGLVLEVEEEKLISPSEEERREALSKILSAGFGKGFSRDSEVKRKIRTPSKKEVERDSQSPST